MLMPLHSLTHWLTHSLTHWLTHSLTHRHAFVCFLCKTSILQCFWLGWGQKRGNLHVWRCQESGNVKRENISWPKKGLPLLLFINILAISRLHPGNRRLAGGIDARARVLRRDVVFCAKHAYYHAFGFVLQENVHITMLLVLFCAKHVTRCYQMSTRCFSRRDTYCTVSIRRSFTFRNLKNS